MPSVLAFRRPPGGSLFLPVSAAPGRATPGRSRGASVGSPTQYENEPAGLVTPYTITATQPNSFDVLPRIWNAADGKPWYALDDYGWCIEAGNEESGDPSRWSIVNDAERGNCLQLQLYAGDAGGSAPGGAAMGGYGHSKPLSNGVDSPFVARQLFVGYYIKLSSNWTDPNVAMKGLYHFNTLTGAGDGDWYNNFTASSYPYLNGGYQIQNGHDPTNDWYGPGIGPGAGQSRGVWHKYEMYAKYNSGRSSGDGILKVWWDGVLAVDFSTLNLGYDGRDFNWLKFGLITGGGTSPVPQDQYMRIDDYYVKVGP